MRVVGIKLLKAKFSEYVRLAKAGESVLVTDHGRNVARLGPPPNRAQALSDAPLVQAVCEGLITPAAAPPGAPVPVPPAGVLSLEEILTDLDRSREDQRPIGRRRSLEQRSPMIAAGMK